MRIGQPVHPAVLASWSPQQLNSAKVSANKRLNQAQIRAMQAKASGSPLPARKPFQQAALSAWVAHTGKCAPFGPGAYNANQLLVFFAQQAKGQYALVTQVYTTWYNKVSNSPLPAPASSGQVEGQLALF
jgi:hypothetical protein